MADDLTTLHCRPLEGVPPMEPAQVEAHLQRVDGWQRASRSIEKTFAFRDFHQTMAFVNALAWICHVEDHHPELVVTYNRCTVRFDTHSVGGLSINDFICAAKVDALTAAPPR
jgi:4a-hydroxytetrahydrobiopterin dehydratase